MRNTITYLLLFICSFLFSQNRIQNFNVFTAGNGVSIKFTISKGAQCAGYRIWQGVDTVNFKLVHNYPGICGDLNVSQDISYFHETPSLNQINYYKAELFPVEFSEIKSLYVSQPAKAGLTIFPNPIVNFNDPIKLQIAGVNNSQLSVIIYNQYGQVIKELKLITVFDLVTLNLIDLKNGVYIIKVNEGNSTYYSKFIIYR